MTARGITVEGLDVTQKGADTMLIDGAYPFDITIRFQLPERTEQLRMGVFVNNALGDELVRTFFSDWDVGQEDLGPGPYTAKLEFPGKLLVPGNYTITMGARKQGGFDLLAGHRIERGINVSAPVDFNSGGVIDPLQSQIILDRRWEITKA